MEEEDFDKKYFGGTFSAGQENGGPLSCLIDSDSTDDEDIQVPHFVCGAKPESSSFSATWSGMSNGSFSSRGQKSKSVRGMGSKRTPFHSGYNGCRTKTKASSKSVRTDSSSTSDSDDNNNRHKSSFQNGDWPSHHRDSDDSEDEIRPSVGKYCQKVRSRVSSSDSREDEKETSSSVGKYCQKVRSHVSSSDSGEDEKKPTEKRGTLGDTKRLSLKDICREANDNGILARSLASKKGKIAIEFYEKVHKCKMHVKYKRQPKKKRAPRPRNRPPPQDPLSLQVMLGMPTHRRESPKNDNRSYSTTINNATITVKQGNITQEQADAIVNVVGPDRDFNKSNISKAMVKAGGQSLQKALRDAKSNDPSAKILTTQGGHLKCASVITLVLNPWTEASSQQAFPELLDECFKHCSTSSFSSISIPVLGCGRMLQYPVQIVASTLVQSATVACTLPGISNITIVAFDRKEYDEVERAMRQGSGASPSTRDASPDGEIVGCEITLSSSRPLPSHIMKKITSDMEDRFLSTEHVHNPKRKCLPLRLKGRIFEVPKTNSKYIHIEIDQKTGDVNLKGEQNVVYECKKHIASLLAGNADLSKRLKCGREYWYHLTYESPQSPPYWSHFPKSRPMADVFKQHQYKSRPAVVPVDKPTDAAVRSLVHNTWQKENVGHGRDAVGLSHTSLKIHKVERIENIDLFAKYAIKRQALFRALADDDTFEFPKIEEIPRQNRGAVKTWEKLKNELKSELFPEINEHYLFHGTKPDVLQTIIHQGLDFRMSSDKAMFGMGVYGAESSTKADQYVDAKTNRTPGKKQMLLLRMLLGKSYICSDQNPKKYRRPPCTSPDCRRDDCVDMHERFDSVVGDGSWLFREFVVYEQDQCYPEYIITYERV